MNKITVGIVFAALCTFQAFAQTIGRIEKGQYKITYNTQEVRQLWESVLVEQNTPTTLSNFVIEEGKMETTGAVFYMLLASNKAKSIKMARQLMLKDSSFVFDDLHNQTVTCTGCSGGCNPILKSDGQWKCSPCDKRRKCTKTVRQNTSVAR